MKNFNLETIFNFIDKGGIVFVLLIFLSFISIAIIIFKIIQFSFISKINFSEIENIIESSKNLEEIQDKFNSYNTDNILVLIIIYACNVFKETSTKIDEKTARVSSFAQKKFKTFDSMMPTLEIISQISPLLGLLGTVIGMISSFNELEIGGSIIDPSILAGGIWTALLTTAIGLIVAIPALISFHYFEKKILNIQEDTNNVLKIIKNI